jgi:bifunctional DNase/RNase
MAVSFRVMDVMSVTVELPDQYPLVTLQEAEPPLRELSFRVGLPEGVALAYALRGVSTPRPLTHELFTTVLQRLRADLVAVRLVSRQGSTYSAEMDVMTAQGREVVPCRPSDGIVLAARQVVSAPILADERLLVGTDDVMPQ